jgi:hypothetical protein
MEKRIAFNLFPLENTQFYYLLGRADSWQSLHRSKDNDPPQVISTGNVKENSKPDDVYILGFINE